VLSEVTYSGGATGPVGPRKLSGSWGRPGASYGLLPVMEFVPPNLRPPGRIRMRSWDGGWSEPTGSLSDRIPLWDAIRRLFLTVVGEIPSWRPGGFDESRKKRAAYNQLLPLETAMPKGPEPADTAGAPGQSPGAPASQCSLRSSRGGTRGKARQMGAFLEASPSLRRRDSNQDSANS
jgi:hypothetical protein